jgi:hypothetical protein
VCVIVYKGKLVGVCVCIHYKGLQVGVCMYACLQGNAGRCACVPYHLWVGVGASMFASTQ